MGNRKHTFSEQEHYHIYNRGVDKRDIFCDQQDYVYFLKTLRAYNTEKRLGKLRLHDNQPPENPPVTMLSYCLLPNHFHLLLRNNIKSGISEYMQRVMGGYTMYFNNKHDRSGSLFQGLFKSKHIDTDQDLRQILAYVHLNNVVHDLHDVSLYRSSLNTKDPLVRGLTSNFSTTEQYECVKIIKELRDGFDA